MRKRVIQQLEQFNEYALSVQKASLFFLKMDDFPTLASDASCTVTTHLGRPEISFSYRDEEAFIKDTDSIREWLNHINGDHAETDNYHSWTFIEEEFTIRFYLWKPL